MVQGSTPEAFGAFLMVHVPFRNSPEAISSVLGRQVDVLFDTISALIGQVQSGELRALAVTGRERFPAVPDVPTVIESGVVPGYDVTTWYGVFAPRGTARAVSQAQRNAERTAACAPCDSKP